MRPLLSNSAFPLLIIISFSFFTGCDNKKDKLKSNEGAIKSYIDTNDGEYIAKMIDNEKAEELYLVS